MKSRTANRDPIEEQAKPSNTLQQSASPVSPDDAEIRDPAENLRELTDDELASVSGGPVGCHGPCDKT
jgi:bacteriocin-like protein